MISCSSAGGYVVRSASAEEAPAISALVVRTLKETNARYYSAAFLDGVVANFAPERVAARFAERATWVASAEGVVIGTASLEKNWVRTVFVDAAWQGRGVGAALLAVVTEAALRAGIDELFVPSSINAEGFYRRLGFKTFRDEFRGEERIILMKRRLDETAAAE